MDRPARLGPGDHLVSDIFPLRFAMALAGVTEISYEQDMVDVTMLHEPDPDWVFVDAAGHEHRWRGDWRKADLPTLVFVRDDDHGDECGCERCPSYHFECRQCGQRVDPETMPSPERRYMPGLARLVWR